MVAINILVNDNTGILVEDPSIDNIDLWFVHMMTDKIPEAMQMVDEVSKSKTIHPQQHRQNKGSFWTYEDHRVKTAF